METLKEIGGVILAIIVIVLLIMWLINSPFTLIAFILLMWFLG